MRILTRVTGGVRRLLRRNGRLSGCRSLCCTPPDCQFVYKGVGCFVNPGCGEVRPIRYFCVDGINALDASVTVIHLNSSGGADGFDENACYTIDRLNQISRATLPGDVVPITAGNYTPRADCNAADCAITPNNPDAIYIRLTINCTGTVFPGDPHLYVLASQVPPGCHYYRMNAGLTDYGCWLVRCDDQNRATFAQVSSDGNAVIFPVLPPLSGGGPFDDCCSCNDNCDHTTILYDPQCIYHSGGSAIDSSPYNNAGPCCKPPDESGAHVTFYQSHIQSGTFTTVGGVTCTYYNTAIISGVIDNATGTNNLTERWRVHQVCSDGNNFDDSGTVDQSSHRPLCDTEFPYQTEIPDHINTYDLCSCNPLTQFHYNVTCSGSIARCEAIDQPAGNVDVLTFSCYKTYPNVAGCSRGCNGSYLPGGTGSGGSPRGRLP